MKVWMLKKSLEMEYSRKKEGWGLKEFKFYCFEEIETYKGDREGMDIWMKTESEAWWRPGERCVFKKGNQYVLAHEKMGD